MLEEIAQRTGIETIPESWTANWPGFAESRPCDGFSLESAVECAGLMDLPVESLPPFQEAIRLVRGNPDLRRLAEFWHHLICHIPGTGDNPSNWPNPQVMGPVAVMFPLVALASGMKHSLDLYAELRTPDDTVRATMADIGLWVRQYHLKHGVWGLGELVWLRKHARARIFIVGRLQYVPTTFRWQFQVFRNKLTGEVVPLCESGLEFRADGLPQGTNGISDPNPWVSEFSHDGEWISGSPVNTVGAASRQRVRLSARKWEQILAPGMDTLDVHIPRSGKMPVTESLESFRLAREFFAEYFPDRRFAAFTCQSWMLDPNLQSILPAESNLAQFQRLWRLVSVPGNESSAFVFVFGDRTVDLSTAPRDTSLRRAILDWLLAGNHMRGAAGFVLIEDEMV